MSDLNTGAQLLERQMALFNEVSRINVKGHATFRRELILLVLRFQMSEGDQSNLAQVETVLLQSFPPVLHDLLEGHISRFVTEKDFQGLVARLKSSFIDSAVQRLVDNVESRKVEITLETVSNLRGYKSLTEEGEAPSGEELLLMFVIAATVRQSLPSKWTRLFRQIQGRVGKQTSGTNKKISYTLEGVKEEFTGKEAKRDSEKYAASVIGEAYAKEVWDNHGLLDAERVEALLTAYSTIFGRERTEDASNAWNRRRPSGFAALTDEKVLKTFRDDPILGKYHSEREHQESCLAIKIFANFCEDLGQTIVGFPV
tara:strand:+ start:124 stop:1065 length:942 start_codon:yes stop_codon:yes gene_type:complete